MDGRLKTLAKRCKNRGGDCPCTYKCQALEAVNGEMERLSAEERGIKKRRDYLEMVKKRLESKPATLRDGFSFDKRYEPVMVFDVFEASFGYEDEGGEWIDADTWPFNEDFVWEDDCERFGIRVE